MSRWAQLDDLIGSADGKKFRNYAQQLTLDILLCYPNRHLQELARRYRLQRIRDSLALMVLDQDSGEEMRSVHSLSDNESFLVSLALDGLQAMTERIGGEDTGAEDERRKSQLVIAEA